MSKLLIIDTILPSYLFLLLLYVKLEVNMYSVQNIVWINRNLSCSI